MIKDSLGRKFQTLRVSLTSTCNLACLYCVCESDALAAKHLPTYLEEQTKGLAPLSVEEYVEIIAKIHKISPLETVRLTGGEPSLFPELEQLIRSIKALGIPKIKMTTNAFLLSRMADKLKAAGLDSINISLDALDAETFFKISRRDKLKETLAGIEAAIKAGFDLKINCVVMRGVNENQIIPLLKFGQEKNIPIRFLELMKMGHLFEESNQYFFSEADILWTIASKFNFHKQTRKSGATANYWQLKSGYKFGIIANESSPFCHDCNRLRLDSFGQIYGCLSTNDGILAKGQALAPALQKAMLQKQTIQFTGSSISMKAIGG